jgi:glutamate/aspartate transport system substrate-binding protein
MTPHVLGLVAAVPILLAAASASAAEPTESALGHIRSSNAVTIGFRETAAPFSFLNQQQQPAGYSIEICRGIVDALRTSLGSPNIEIKFVPVTPQSRIPLIANGTVDIECGTTVNSLTRQQQVDFTYAVALSEGRMLVLKNSGINAITDLQGKVVAIASGTTADRYVPKALQEHKLDARILQVRDNDEGFLAVSTKRADAFINDAVLLGGVLRNSPDRDKFMIAGDPLSFEQVAFMVQKNNSGLLTTANGTIARMLASGRLQELYDQWVAPYGAPREGAVEALFKIQAVAE